MIILKEGNKNCKYEIINTNSKQFLVPYFEMILKNENLYLRNDLFLLFNLKLI
jgi:hypothetical protein